MEILEIKLTRDMRALADRNHYLIHLHGYAFRFNKNKEANSLFR